MNNHEIFNDLFIFEMANNHNGDVDLAIRIVKTVSEIAKQYNINAAVKIQYRDMNTFVHPDYRESKDIRQIPRFYNTDLTKAEYKRIITAVKKEKLLSMCTPFDEISVDLCMEHDVDIIKIASSGCEDWPLIEKAVTIGKPLVISFGAHTLQHMDRVYSFLSRRNAVFAMLHCIASYPVVDLAFQLDIIQKMIL